MNAHHKLDEVSVPVDGVTKYESVQTDDGELTAVLNAVVVERAEVEEYFWPDGEPFADYDAPMGHLPMPLHWTARYASESIQEAAARGVAWARRRLGLPVLPRRGNANLRPFVVALADLVVASILKDRAAS